MKDPLMSEMQIKFPLVFSGKIGKLKNLNKRLEQDIIDPLFGLPTDWISQLVLFFKPSSPDLRITVDYREVNKLVKRERHLLPTLEKIVVLVQDATIIDFLDLNSAFEQVE